MSADNWAVCPKCSEIFDKELRNSKEELESSYGNIPIEEYIVLLEKSKEEKEQELSMREDYELCIDENNTFICYYSCSCEKCGFRYSYSAKEKI